MLQNIRPLFSSSRYRVTGTSDDGEEVYLLVEAEDALGAERVAAANGMTPSIVSLTGTSKAMRVARVVGRGVAVGGAVAGKVLFRTAQLTFRAGKWAFSGRPQRAGKRRRGIELYAGNTRGLPSSNYTQPVVGEKSYARNLRRIVGRVSADGVVALVDAELFLEDDNPHDANAVRVDVNRLTVGYLPREDAPSFRRSLPRGARSLSCEAMIRAYLEDEDDPNSEPGFSVSLRF